VPVVLHCFAMSDFTRGLVRGTVIGTFVALWIFMAHVVDELGEIREQLGR
jgi:hypothetical protein